MPSFCKHLVAILLIATIAGCATQILYRPASSIEIKKEATFAVSLVKYIPRSNDSDSDVDFDIAERFNEAMHEALSDIGKLKLWQS
ncbi:hypothetical protein LJC48_04715 [Desulfovibrio sp. OttesenSCG-928-C06]|nr:hypothetical protein [Desulfovibrio sp. OttesenSCG-928-C06]